MQRTPEAVLESLHTVRPDATQNRPARVVCSDRLWHPLRGAPHFCIGSGGLRFAPTTG
jgi:hypothetical protein